MLRCAAITAVVAAAALVMGASAARVRVVHAIPEDPNIDFLVNGAVSGIRNLAYTQASAYLDLRPGILTLAVSVRGEAANVQASGLFEIVSNIDYTLLYMRETVDGDATLVLKVDDNTQPREKFAHLRFIHAAPVSPAVPLVVEANGMPLFSNFEYGQGSPYQPIPAGFYNITFTTRDDATEVVSVLTSVPEVRYESRTVYTLFALGVDIVVAALSVDAAATPVDPCASCPCPHLGNDLAFTTNTEVNFVFEDLVPPQTACCKKGF
jgi:hypothetical protein